VIDLDTITPQQCVNTPITKPSPLLCEFHNLAAELLIFL
jgi:hypothetical protein